MREIVRRLRAPDGCPWDRRQTLESLRYYLLEETYELLEAIDGGQPGPHCEELGDLLFQVVLQAQLRSEERAFELCDVVRAIADKIERRHPHVFAGEVVADEAAIRNRWDELKKAEGKGSLWDVPRSLPALMRAEEVGQKAAKLGFDWPAGDVAGPLDKLDEEVAELREALAADDPAAVEAELGDVLFAAVNVARRAGVRAELALAGTVDRFLGRFRHVEARLAEAGRAPADATLDELEALWQEAKAEPPGEGNPAS